MVDEGAPRPIGLVAEARVRWLSALETAPRLPERTVIVGNEATAHAWRRDVVDARPDLLIGTRFITSIAAATAVLELAGVTFSLGEEAVRAARVVALLDEGLAFQAFVLDVLRGGRGWGDAIAWTLGEVEGAWLDVATLTASPDPRCRDLALVLERLDRLAGTSWAIARMLREATVRLAADPSLWPFGGACLAEVTGHESMVMASWLRAIPRGRIVSIATQPRRPEYVQRVRARFGELALQDIETATTSELGLLATYLFSAPEVLAAPGRPRSMGNDGTTTDVERALIALRDADLIGDRRTVRLEYPVAAARDGQLVTGYLDFVSAAGDETAIDFNTDQPAGTDVLETYPEYVRQLATYAEIIGARRSGLLFTATGQLAWLT